MTDKKKRLIEFDRQLALGVIVGAIVASLYDLLQSVYRSWGSNQILTEMDKQIVDSKVFAAIALMIGAAIYLIITSRRYNRQR